MTVDVYFTFDQIVYCLVLLLQFLVVIVSRVISCKVDTGSKVYMDPNRTNITIRWVKLSGYTLKKLPVNLHAADLLEGMIFPGKFYCAMPGICCCSDLHKMSHPNATKGELSIAYLR